MALWHRKTARQPADASDGGAAPRPPLPPHPTPPPSAYIRSQQLLCIVNAAHQDLTLADERVVIRVGCNKQQLCNDDHLEEVTWMQRKHPLGAFSFCVLS